MFHPTAQTSGHGERRPEPGWQIEAWPGLPIKGLGYIRSERYEFDPTGTLLAPRGPWVHEEWRGQTYLELFSLDLADPQAILGFVDRFGTLGVFGSEDLSSEGLASYLEGDVEAQLLAARRTVQEAPENREWLVGRIDPELGEDPYWEDCESLAEFRFGARLIRDLTRAWTFVSNPDSAVPDWELPLAGWARDQSDPELRLARTLLSEGLSHILSAMHPRITLVELDDSGTAKQGLVTTRDPPRPHDLNTRISPFRPVSLGLVCALELYNHILLEASYKQCRFAGCDRLFVFKEDRRHSGRPAAIHRKPRRDSLFCSPECQRAQAQRQHCQRKRARDARPT